MSFDVQDYRKWLEKQKAQREQLEGQIRSTEAAVEESKSRAARLVKARWVLSEVARLTQGRFKKYVEDLVTMAIRSVLDQPLRFVVDFKIVRNKSECYLRVRDGDSEPYVPKSEQGGLVVNLIGFALKIVLLSLEVPPSRRLLVLDEPLPFSGKGEPLRRIGEMLRMVSLSPPQGLGFQLVIVTHEPELAAMGNRAWSVGHDGVCSDVRQLAGAVDVIVDEATNTPSEIVNGISAIQEEAHERKELEL